ncbi:MAG: glycosyltransferase [Solirubrobacterales bacterium]
MEDALPHKTPGSQPAAIDDPYATNTCDTYDLDVLIVTYNNEGHISSALQSIARQSGIRATYFVQDNGSKDSTVSCINRLAKNLGLNLHLIVDETNPGYAAAINVLLQRSSSEYVLVLNPDTLSASSVDETTISRLCKVASISDIGLVTPRLLTHAGLLDKACRRREPTVSRSLATFATKLAPGMGFFERWGYNYLYQSDTGQYSVDAINGAFMLTTRRKIEVTGGMNERFWMYGEDLDWCRRFRVHGFHNTYVGDSVWIHLKGGSEGGRRGRRTQIAFLNSMSTYYEIHHPGRWYAPMRLAVRVTVGLAVFATSVRHRKATSTK